MADATDNETTFQTMIDAQYALLQSEQTLYAQLQAQRTALTTLDIGSVNNSGEAGAESYSAATITEQLARSAERLKELIEELRELMRLKNERFPWIRVHDNLRCWGCSPCP